jgi:hypothetical protein
MARNSYERVLGDDSFGDASKEALPRPSRQTQHRWFTRPVIAVFVAGLALGSVISRGGQSWTTSTASWSSTPSLAIIARVYEGAAVEAWVNLLPSYQLFFPSNSWTNAELVMVWDDDNVKDRAMATLLSQLSPYPRMAFEERPPEGTLCDKWRRAGYSRQQYSNFLFDRYTDADFIGMLDSDNFFHGPITPAAWFNEETGKPIIMGHNGRGTGWDGAPAG